MGKFYKILKIIFMFLIIINMVSKCFAVTDVNVTNIVYGDELYNEIMRDEENRQNQFVYTCLFPYLGNTQAWNNSLKPIFDTMHEGNYSIYVGMNQSKSSGVVTNANYSVVLYYTSATTDITMSYKSRVTGQKIIIYANSPTDGNFVRYNVSYNIASNTFTVTQPTTTDTWPNVVNGFRSDLMYEFINTIYGVGNNYSGILNIISNYLDSIDTVNNDILSNLTTITNSLNTISSNTNKDYSQQIGQINNKVENLLNDNQTIISQNSDMIEQQEQINDNLEQVSNNIEDVKDTITDDTIESSASDLPSTNVTNPTENGIDNIFTSIYNAFCVGEAQDIIFPIPFTNKNITLSPYYVRDMLNNNNAGWIYTLIQVFWGYLIGRYIVSDISKKIDKIKSGNIENVENTNIKEEML